MNPLLESYLIKAENFLLQRISTNVIRASIGVLVHPDCVLFKSCQWRRFIVTVLPDAFLSPDKAYMMIRDYTVKVWNEELQEWTEETKPLIWWDNYQPEYQKVGNNLSVDMGVRFNQLFPEMNIQVVVS